MQIHDLQTDATGRELTERTADGFPCAYYDEKFSEFVTGEVPWHWHDEIELVYVVAGSTKVEVTQQSAVLSAGDAVFVNAGVLHKLTDVGDVDCHILNFVVYPSFMGDSLHGRIFQKYILPVINNQELPMFVFKHNVDWHKTAIDFLVTAFTAYGKKAPRYEMKVQQNLIGFWVHFCEQQKDILSGKTISSVSEERLQRALQFVHEHYHKHITVSDIGAAINVSESECFRLFNKAINITPVQYLLNYRLQVAANTLLETKEPITRIAHITGFNSSSYFSKRFSEKFGVTPNTFRKNQR